MVLFLLLRGGLLFLGSNFLNTAQKNAGPARGPAFLRRFAVEN